MKTVVQRVSRASVDVDGDRIAEIGPGLLLLVGVERGDAESDADVSARKIASLRIFPASPPEPAALAAAAPLPARAPMDRTVRDIGGGCLVVSQFTLAASLAKGSRPSFEPAESPARAEALYLRLAEQLRQLGLPVQTGRFGADMQVDLRNDGPATFLVFTRAGSLVKEP